MLFKLILRFGSGDKILNWDQSTERYRAVLCYTMWLYIVVVLDYCSRTLG